MNNRHKELYMQAKNGESIYSDIDFFLWYDRVAELIVRECAWAADFAEDTSPGDYVKKHFGLK